MRIAYFLTHPIQYQAPLIRHLRLGGVDLHVIYGNDATARSYFDKGFGMQFAWDVPLIEGYPSIVLNAEDPQGSAKEQREHFERQIAALLDRERFDAVWVHGWAHPFTQAAWRQARRRDIPLLLRGETFLGCVRGGPLRRFAHKVLFGRKFRDVSAFLAVGTLNHQLYRAYGVAEGRIFPAPYVVDNVFFRGRAEAARPQREFLRERLGIAPGSSVILFCGKLTAVKSPDVLIRAVGRMRWQEKPPVLLLAGDGELRPDLEALVHEVAPGLVKFLGFHNQSELPALYDLCDVFVLPSAFEPWGLVVNEVMNAGKPVIVSDQVGSGPDLVREGENGSIFPVGDVSALACSLERWTGDAALREQAGQRSREFISRWGFDEVLSGVSSASTFVQEEAKE
ncbi:MAG: glycosyltransferase family 4 protein [Prosthecobacter sp.]